MRLLSIGTVVFLAVSTAHAQAPKNSDIQTDAARGERPAERESDGLEVRSALPVTAAIKVGWTAETDVVAELSGLRNHPDGKGLDVIRLRGVQTTGRITWVEAVRLKDEKPYRRAGLRTPLWTIAGAVETPAPGIDVIVKGGVNPMIRVARSLLGDDDDDDGKGKSGIESGSGASGSGGGRSGGTSRASAARSSNGTGSGWSGGTSSGTSGSDGTSGTTTGTGWVDGTETVNTGTGWTPETSTDTGWVDGTETVNTGTGWTPETSTGTGWTPGTTTTGGTETTTTGTTAGVNQPTTTTATNGDGDTTSGDSDTTSGSGNATNTGSSIAAASNLPQMASTTVGCADRIDLAGLRAYAQSKDMIYTDGVLTSQSACSDDLYVYEIRFDGTSCSDDVDSGAGWAYDRGRPYYVNVSGTSTVIGGCQRYENRSHRITATEDGCSHDVDVVTGIAKIRTRRTYTSSSGQVVEVAGCAASGATAPLAWTTAGCEIRHDLGGATSYQQGRRYYVYNGAEYRVGGCEDHGSTFAHYRVESGCTNVENDSAHTVQIFKRTVANLPSGQTTIVDCSADSTIGMAADYAACTGQYSHVPAASVSYGMVRYTYQVNGALQASACVVDPARSYAHQDAMGSWTHDDGARKSRQSIITFIDTESGNVVVSTREGAWIDDYSATGTEIRPNVQATSYSGCTRSVPNDQYTTYTRTDGTTVTLLSGASTPTVSADGCSPIASLVEVLREWTSESYSIKPSGTLTPGNGLVPDELNCFKITSHFREVRTTERMQNGAGEIFNGATTTNIETTSVDRQNVSCGQQDGTQNGG